MSHKPIHLEQWRRPRPRRYEVRTLEECAAFLGVSKERARQIEKKACMKLLRAAVREFGKDWAEMGMPLPCQDKRAYMTIQEAQRAADKAKKDRDVPYLRVYACPDCGAFHLTSKKPKAV